MAATNCAWVDFLIYRNTEELPMSRILVAGIFVTGALFSIAAPVVACLSGLVKGSFQGHKVCHHTPGGNNKYQANPARTLLGEKKTIRAAQRTLEY